MSLRTGTISLVTLLACSVLVSSCAGYRHRENLRDGLIVLDMAQGDFLDVWDKPTYTRAVSGDEIIKSGIAGWGGFFFKGRKMYELWDYAPRRTQLVFYEGRLVAWKTGLPVNALAVPEPDYIFGSGGDETAAATGPASAETEPAADTSELEIPAQQPAAEGAAL